MNQQGSLPVKHLFLVYEQTLPNGSIVGDIAGKMLSFLMSLDTTIP
jgi:hypothetical protein